MNLFRKSSLLLTILTGLQWSVATNLFGSDPDIVVRIPEHWVRSQIETTIDHRDNVNTQLLGTRVKGTARTTGTVDVDLQSRDDHAHINIRVRGRVATKTQGYNGPVVIESTCWTDFDAVVPVRISASGTDIGPVLIDGSTNSKTDSIASRRKLLGGVVRRVAAKRVEENRATANHITRCQTLQSLAQHIQQHVAQEVSALPSFAELLPTALKQFVGHQHFVCSSDDSLIICFGEPHSAVPTLSQPCEKDVVEIWIRRQFLSHQLQRGGSVIALISNLLRHLPLLQAQASPGVLLNLGSQLGGLRTYQIDSKWIVLRTNPSTLLGFASPKVSAPAD